MNNNILQSLNQYLTNPDPQYALMIKGKWGCGKTFFIKKWIKKLEESHKDDKEPKPIYVSLYGLKTTQEITTSINRVLYPRLYGKAAKVGKSLLKIVTGIVLLMKSYKCYKDNWIKKKGFSKKEVYIIGIFK